MGINKHDAVPQQAEEADILAIGHNVLERESEAILRARERMNGAFVAAVRCMLATRGRVAVTGMGKAGLVGRKIQATLASTATPSLSIHPAEAIHGDLGMLTGEDLVLALSNSGETQELVQLLPAFQKLGCKVILITGRPNSRCAQAAEMVLDIGDVPEACPLGLAPSSSTTAMLAVGDALALTVMRLRGVRPDQYAAFHPGGALGRSLMKVEAIMRTGRDCPRLTADDPLSRYYDVVREAPRRAGAAAVVDAEDRLIGFFTDGDLRRCVHEHHDPHTTRVGQVMTADPKSASAGQLVADALRLMQRYKVDELPAVDQSGRLVGLVDVQDLVAHGFSTFDDQ